jgi:phosphoglycolate phosphatase-like HAD superfamily hydrolase
MKSLSDYKVLFWDFDGVIIDSMKVRETGFRRVLHSFPEHQVEKLICFHKENGGWSRYVKFRYFFETIRKEVVSDDVILRLSQDFSSIMRELLISPHLLIEDSTGYIRSQSPKPMHIVSGSDGIELRHLCEEHVLVDYFISIHGSPSPKEMLIKELLEKHSYSKNEVLLIGDARNDRDAAILNEIDFAGYNNEDLRHDGVFYIDSFSN